jgi:hypothetical protein
MQVIFSRAAADQLRERYTVLELETFSVGEDLLEAFCVVPAEKMNLGDLPNLDSHIKMHQELIEQLKVKNYQFCIDAIEHLMGKFGGELDSFYEIILERCNENVT